MFVKNKSTLQNLHRHSKQKSQHQNILQKMHKKFAFPLFCTFLAGSIFLTQIMASFGQTIDDGMIREDLRFSRRHFHRQQNRKDNLLSVKRRSIQSNNGNLPNSNSINAQDPNNLINGQVSGRPAVCASCMARELYRNITLQAIQKDILKKLKMENGPPQVSRKDFDQHMMGQIVDRYRKTHQHIDQYGVVQSDDAFNGGFEDDNEFSTTNQVTILAQKRKYKFLYHMIV